MNILVYAPVGWGTSYNRLMAQKITRREIAAATVAGAIARAQTQPPAATEEELPAARKLIERNAALLAKVEMPPATEPVFVFKA